MSPKHSPAADTALSVVSSAGDAASDSAEKRMRREVEEQVRREVAEANARRDEDDARVRREVEEQVRREVAAAEAKRAEDARIRREIEVQVRREVKQETEPSPLAATKWLCHQQIWGAAWHGSNLFPGSHLPQVHSNSSLKLTQYLSPRTNFCSKYYY